MRARLAGLLLSLVAVGSVFTVTEGCSNSGSSTDGSGSTPATDRGKTAASRSGESIARGMLGLPEQPLTADDPADQTTVKRYEALAGHFFDVLELTQPGSLDHFGTEMASKDADRMVAAWADMRAKLETVSESPQLEKYVANDPLFSGLGIGTAAYPIHFADTPPATGDDIPNLGLGPDGHYGDANQGALGALKDVPGLGAIPASLSDVDSGRYTPDPESRLGAYAATKGYPPGTVGNAVHHAIGTIYVVFGTYGEEKIGRVFNDPAAKALYNDPVDSPSGQRMAQIELRYWNNVAKEDPYSGGGKLGSAFGANFRNWLQQNIFGSKSAAANLPKTGSSSSSSSSGSTSSSSSSSSSGGSGDAGLNPTDCGDKSDGWWCLGSAGFMAYCKDKSIAGGCACAACTTQGQQASCAADPPPAACPGN